MATPVATAVRNALATTLLGDGVLVGLLGGPNVFHRYLRTAPQIGIGKAMVTYFDYTSHPENTIPRRETRVQIDVWDKDVDAAELKADRITKLLDQFEAVDAGLTPFQVTTGETNVVVMRLESERDDIAGEAPEIARKTLMFNLVGLDL